MNNHYDPNQPRNAEGEWTDAGDAIRSAASDLQSFEKAAIEKIKNGGNFNGKFYTDKHGKTFIYVSNEKFQIKNKIAFLAALQYQHGGFTVRSSRDIQNISRYGYDAIEM